VKIVDLESPDDDPGLLQRAFDEVLRPSFSIEELPGFGSLMGALEGHGFISIATDDDGVPLAVGLSESDSTTQIGLLGYLATRPDRRSGGVGGALLSHMQERWAAEPVTMVLAEVHDPRAWPETDDERAAARLRFYERAGGRLLMAPWVQPSLSVGAARVNDMLLLILSEKPEGQEAIDPANLRLWTLGYYMEAEGGEPEDATYVALQQRMAGGRIEIMPVSAYRDLEPLRP
jgi:GNAT superfamily N-acetyltransferase